jgi:hypothetical protein
MGVSQSRVERFEPVDKRTKWVYWTFIILVVVNVVSVLSGYAEAGLLNRVIGGEAITESEATASDVRQGLIGFAQFTLYIACAVTFLMWVHRIYKNLPSLGATGLRFTPGWAVGWFLYQSCFFFVHIK